MTNLDLYAKVEHLLGIDEASEALYDVYRAELANYEIKTLLDVGCGRGGFMQRLISDGVQCKGIDLSSAMIEDCKAQGLDAECIDVHQASGKYDAIVSIFDVLNFLDKDALVKFLDAIANRLKDDGVFIADINTLFGFSNVAEGTMSRDAGDEFLNVDAVFRNDELRTMFTLFEQQEDKSFIKHQNYITQYFHKIKVFQHLSHLKLVDKQTFSLYAKNDKTLLIFKKS